MDRDGYKYKKCVSLKDSLVTWLQIMHSDICFFVPIWWVSVFTLRCNEKENFLPYKSEMVWLVVFEQIARRFLVNREHKIQLIISPTNKISTVLVLKKPLKNPHVYKNPKSLSLEQTNLWTNIVFLSHINQPMGKVRPYCGSGLEANILQPDCGLLVTKNCNYGS